MGEVMLKHGGHPIMYPSLTLSYCLRMELQQPHPSSVCTRTFGTTAYVMITEDLRAHTRGSQAVADVFQVIDR